MFTYSMTEEQISKGIKSLASRNSKWNEEAHKLCVSILAQWVKGKSPQKPVALATQLVNEAGQYRAQALVNWFGKYAGFEWEKKAFSYTSTTITEDRAKEAKAEPFYKLTKAAEPKPFNLKAEVAKLIAKADNHQKKPVEGDDVPVDILASLRALAA